MDNPPDGYLNREQRHAYAAVNRGRIVVGCRVGARYPNARLGEGTVTAIVADRRLKPLVVQMGEGEKYFHYDQVDLVSLPSDQPARGDHADVPACQRTS